MMCKFGCSYLELLLITLILLCNFKKATACISDDMCGCVIGSKMNHFVINDFVFFLNVINVDQSVVSNINSFHMTH